MTDKNTTDKTIVHPLFYALLIFITLVMASGLAIQNGLYGYEQGSTEFRSWVTGGLYFVGDIGFIALSYYFFHRYITYSFCMISAIGFMALSMFSGVGFLAGQSHTKDNYQIISKQKQIERKDEYLKTIP